MHPILTRQLRQLPPSMFSDMLTRILLGSMLLSLYGCSFFANQAIKIESIEYLHVEHVDADSIGFKAGIRLRNESSASIRLEEVSAKMVLGEHHLPASQVASVVVPAKDSATVAFPVSVPMSDVSEPLIRALLAKRTPYRATVEARPLSSKAPKVTVTLNGRLDNDTGTEVSVGESLSRKLIRVVSINRLSLGLLGVKAVIKIRLTNPFPFPLIIEKFEYDLSAGNLALGNGYFAESTTIARGHSKTVEVAHDAAWPNPLGLLGSAPSLVPPINLTVKGQLTLGGGLAGRPIPLNTSVAIPILAEPSDD